MKNLLKLTVFISVIMLTFKVGWALDIKKVPTLTIVSTQIDCSNGITKLRIKYAADCRFHSNEKLHYIIKENGIAVESHVLYSIPICPYIEIPLEKVICKKNYTIGVFPDDGTGHPGSNPYSEISISIPNECCRDCCKEYVSNGSFESYSSPPVSPNNSDNISLATFWYGLFANTFSKGDYFDNQSTPYAWLPNPCVMSPSNKFAGIWLHPGKGVAREGLQNKLNATIAPGTGNYQISIDLAVAQVTTYTHTYPAVLEIYAIKNPSFVSYFTTTGLNTSLYSGNVFKLCDFTINTPASTCPIFNNLQTTVNMGILPTGFSFDKIMITRSDASTGKLYVYLDNVSIKKCCPDPKTYAPITSEFVVNAATSGIPGEYKLKFSPSLSFINVNNQFNVNCPASSKLVHQFGLIEIPDPNCDCNNKTSAQLSAMAGSIVAVEQFWYTGGISNGFNYNLKPNKCYIIKHGLYFDSGHPLEKECPWDEGIACYRLSTAGNRQQLFITDQSGKTEKRLIK